MSCADVCLDHGYDESNAFYAEDMRKARQPHTCCECAEGIPVGVLYQRASGKSGGDIWSMVTCARCAEIRTAFVCGGWSVGELWESIHEGIFPIWEQSGPIDCLAKVETLAARDKLREAYRAWTIQAGRTTAAKGVTA